MLPGTGFEFSFSPSQPKSIQRSLSFVVSVVNILLLVLKVNLSLNLNISPGSGLSPSQPNFSPKVLFKSPFTVKILNKYYYLQLYNVL